MRFFWQKPKPATEVPKSEVEILRDKMLSEFASDPSLRPFMDGMRRGDPSSYFKMGEYLAAQDPDPFGKSVGAYWGGAFFGSVPCLWKLMNVNIKLLSGKRISSFEDYFQETAKQLGALPFNIDLGYVIEDSPLLSYYRHVRALSRLNSPDSIKEFSKIRDGEKKFFRRSNELYVLIQTDGIVFRHGQAAALFGFLMEMPPDGRVNLVKAHLWYQIAIANGFELVVADLMRVEGKMNPVEIAEAKSIFKKTIDVWNDSDSKPLAPSVPLKPFSEIAGVSQLAFISTS